MTDRFTLRIAQSVMAPEIDDLDVIVDQTLNPEVTALRWSWGETGPAALDVSLLRHERKPVVGIIPADMAIPEHAHVELWHGSTILWDGYVLTEERGLGGVITRIAAAGYMQSLADIEWDYTGYSSATTGEQMMRRLLDQRAPWLRPDTSGRWIDPLVTLGALDSYNGQSVAQIVDIIRNAGDIARNQLWIMARPGRSVVMEPRLAPTEPHYRIAFDHRVQAWTADYSQTARAVRARYGPSSSPASTDLAVNPDSESFRVVTVQAGDVGVDAANALRDAELARRGEPIVKGTLTTTRDVRTWLTLSGGQSVPWWQPVVGEWVAVAGYNPLPIVGVTVDAIGGSATYELGERDLSLSWNRGRLARQTAVQFATQTAPMGGRLR